MAKESENDCAPDRGTQLLLLLLQPVPGAVQELQLLLLLLLSAQVFHNFKILFLGRFLFCKEHLFQLILHGTSCQKAPRSLGSAIFLYLKKKTPFFE